MKSGGYKAWILEMRLRPKIRGKSVVGWICICTAKNDTRPAYVSTVPLPSDPRPIGQTITRCPVRVKRLNGPADLQSRIGRAWKMAEDASGRRQLQLSLAEMTNDFVSPIHAAPERITRFVSLNDVAVSSSEINHSAFLVV